MRGTALLPLLAVLGPQPVAPGFLPYACIQERSVDLKVWEFFKNELVDPIEVLELHNTNSSSCLAACEKHAFMFFLPEKPGDQIISSGEMTISLSLLTRGRARISRGPPFRSKYDDFVVTIERGACAA
jgi:hypothetical protein